MTDPAILPKPFIRKTEGFVRLTDEERTVLAEASASPRMVKAGTVLLEEEQSPGGVHLILGGVAYRYKSRANGRRQIMAYLVPGDLGDVDIALIGEMDHSIGAFSDCWVVWMGPEAMQRFQQYLSIVRGLRMGTLVDEATLREWLLNVGGRSAIKRLAHRFCEVYLRLDVVGLKKEGSYDLPLT